MNCYPRDIIEKTKSPPDSRHLYCLMSGYWGTFFYMVIAPFFSGYSSPR